MFILFFCYLLYTIFESEQSMSLSLIATHTPVISDALYTSRDEFMQNLHCWLVSRHKTAARAYALIPSRLNFKLAQEQDHALIRTVFKTHEDLTYPNGAYVILMSDSAC